MSLDAEGRDAFAGAIEPERFACLQTLLFRGENDRSRVAQHSIFRPRPVEPFLQMFERKCALEPRVEHSMRENIVRNRRAGEATPCSETEELPEPFTITRSYSPPWARSQGRS